MRWEADTPPERTLKSGDPTTTREVKSRRTETIPGKTFQVLIQPTRIVSACPVQPSPEYPTRRTEPTIDNIPAECSEQRPRVLRPDKPWSGAQSPCTIGERSRPWTEAAYSRIIQEQALAAYCDVLANREEIVKRRPPQRSDLKFNRYAWNMKSPIRTAAAFKRGGLVPMLGARDESGEEMPAEDVMADRKWDVTTEFIAATRRRGYITPRDRELLELQRWRDKGLTQEEIGRRMNLSTAQVQRRCAEIKQMTGVRRGVATTLVDVVSKREGGIPSDTYATTSQILRRDEEVLRDE